MSIRFRSFIEDILKKKKAPKLNSGAFEFM